MLTPLSFTELLAWARSHPCTRTPGTVSPKRHNHSACQAGAAILEMLSPAIPCGYETPIAIRGVVDDNGDEFDPDEARGMASALLRAAEEVACQHETVHLCSTCNLVRCRRCPGDPNARDRRVAPAPVGFVCSGCDPMGEKKASNGTL